MKTIFRTAAWQDVQQKGKRLRDSGAILDFAYEPDVITAKVMGDSGSLYDVALYRQYPGSKSLTFWECSCKWGSYAWDRKKYFGRLCSHAAAVLFEAQSQDSKITVSSSISELSGNCGPVALQGLADDPRKVRQVVERYGWQDGGDGMTLAEVLMAAEDLGLQRTEMVPDAGVARFNFNEGKWLLFVDGHVFGKRDGRVVGVGAGYMDQPINVAVKFAKQVKSPDEVEHRSKAWLFLMPKNPEQLTSPTGNAIPTDDLHVTVAMFGDLDHYSDEDRDLIENVVEELKDLDYETRGEVREVGTLGEDNQTVIFLDSPYASNLHEGVLHAIEESGLELHPDAFKYPDYRCHLSVDWDGSGEAPDVSEIEFSEIVLRWGDEETHWRIGDEMSTLSHVLGDRDKSVSVMPTVKSRKSAKRRVQAGRALSYSEQMALINETGTARNSGKLDLEGTFYLEEEPSSEFILFAL